MRPVKPPKGLFARIIRRLGLEQQLLVIRRHLGFFTGVLVVFVFLSIFAFVGLRDVLEHSSFWPMVSLIFSDPDIVIKNWPSFSLSIFESVPAVDAMTFLVLLGLAMVVLKSVSLYLEKIILINKKINNK